MIGKIIQKLREERNISRYQLAKEIGVTDQAIKYWEEEINEPKASYIRKLAIYFDVSADYLLAIEDIGGRKIYSIHNNVINNNGNINFQ